MKETKLRIVLKIGLINVNKSNLATIMSPVGNRQETTDNKTSRELKEALVDLNSSTKRSSFLMVVLTIVIFILTSVLVWQGFIK